jgi:hypothetical protein
MAEDAPIRLHVIDARRMLPPLPWRSSRWPRKLLLVILSAMWLAIMASRFALQFWRMGPIFTAGALLVAALLVVPCLRRWHEARHDFGRRWRRSLPARLGVDGIALGEGDFVRYQEIVGLEWTGDRLLLNVGGPDPLVLEISPTYHIVAREMIERGRQARLRISTDELEAVLRRGDESEQAWRSRVGVLDDGAGYRVAGLNRERLWRIAADAGADPSARVAAFELLGRALDVEKRRELAAMRAETAHPELCAAFDVLEETFASAATSRGVGDHDN